MEFSLLGYSWDFNSLLVGALLPFCAYGVGYGLSKIFPSKKEKQSFTQIKDKLMEAYEGNKKSAEVINELYALFNDVENEVKKLG